MMHGRSIQESSSSDQGGYAMLAVTIFVFIVILGGIALFSNNTSESKLSHHNQESIEAFFLADGAVERAKARLQTDEEWRDGWIDVPLGNGAYSLSIVDTMISGVVGVSIVSDGVVGNAHRRLLVSAQTPPATAHMAMISGLDVTGEHSLRFEPYIAVRGTRWFGVDDEYIQAGEVVVDPDLLPPMMHTDPAHWPNSTFYQVRSVRQGGNISARIFDRNGNDLTGTLGDDLPSIMSYSSSSKTFTYDFTANGIAQTYFDDDTGVFSRASGDGSVVVDFGLPAFSDPPGVQATANVDIAGSSNLVLTATVINTRFIGSTEEQRFDTNFWLGGETNIIEQMTAEPLNGVSLVGHDISLSGPSIKMGKGNSPAMTYATGDLDVQRDGLGHNTQSSGAMICLGSTYFGGNHRAEFDPALLDIIPAFLLETWPGYGGINLRIVDWREISPYQN